MSYSHSHFYEVPKQIHKHRLGYYWWVLAFQAGAINAGAVILFNTAVSHVTGLGTSFGIDAAAGNWRIGLILLSIPFFFLLGTIFTTFIKIKNYSKNFYHALEQCFVVMLFVFLLIFLLELSGLMGVSGPLATTSQKYMVIVLLGFACGMQNALFNGLVKGVIRSTHMTGTTTDLGVDIGKILFTPSEMNKQDRSLTIARFVSLVFFVIGALISSYFYHKFSFYGFLLPCFTMFVLLVDVYRRERQTNAA